MFCRNVQFGFSTAMFALALLASVPSTALPVQPMNVASIMGSQMEEVSFWGLPYPYGYAYRGHRCARYVKVRTEFGWRTRRVWGCR